MRNVSVVFRSVRWFFSPTSWVAESLREIAVAFIAFQGGNWHAWGYKIGWEAAVFVVAALILFRMFSGTYAYFTTPAIAPVPKSESWDAAA